MTKESIQSLIDLMEELRGRGEAMLDIPIRVYQLFRDTYPALGNEYSAVYSDFYNNDIKEVPRELHDRVIEHLRNLQRYSTEPKSG